MQQMCIYFLWDAAVLMEKIAAKIQLCMRLHKPLLTKSTTGNVRKNLKNRVIE